MRPKSSIVKSAEVPLMDKEHVIIAISAISGGGKSTVAHKLVEVLGDAVAIHFDDYTTPDTFPKDPVMLLEGGADFNRIKSPLLAHHLQALQRGESITSPNDNKIVAPAKYIIFEGPLGRAQQETGQYIDFLVFIDTPLEVGLARRILRSTPISAVEAMTREALIEQLSELGWLAENYLQWMRRIYLAQIEFVKPASDLIVAWDQSVDELAQAILMGLAEAQLMGCGTAGSQSGTPSKIVP